MEFDLLPNHEKLKRVMEEHVGVWHLETRSGPTGQGHTFESIVLDKREDNKAEADIYETEIKTCSAKSPSARIRTATVKFSVLGDDGIATGAAASILDAFGAVNAKGKLCFNRSVRCGKPTKWGGKAVNLTSDDKALRLQAGDISAFIPREEIDAIIDTKLQNLAVIKTNARKVRMPGAEKDQKEYHFHGHRYFKGAVKEKFWSAIETGKFAFEFRIRGDHDHGVSMNINLNRIADLYTETYDWDGLKQAA